jgi:hypothetical protein
MPHYSRRKIKLADGKAQGIEAETQPGSIPTLPCSHDFLAFLGNDNGVFCRMEVRF